MSLNDLRDRFDREFAALRADVKRVEAAIVQVQRATEVSRDARVKSATALLRGIEWRVGKGNRRCPVCAGTAPKHAAPCGLAAALAALRP